MPDLRYLARENAARGREEILWRPRSEGGCALLPSDVNSSWRPGSGFGNAVHYSSSLRIALASG